MLTNLSKKNSLLSTWMRELRDSSVQTDRMRFRRNLERVGEIAAYEISKTLPYKKTEIQTPMGICTCVELAQQPVIATILRAGMPLQQGILNYFDGADCAFVASFRKHNRDGSFKIHQSYLTAPETEGRPLIIADPMLATGSSLLLAIDDLLNGGQPTVIHIVTAIACTQGIEAISRRYPAAHIWTGAIDEELTARGYIVPGLGDAGDLSFGSKRQS